MAQGMVITSGKHRLRATSTTSTSAVVITAWRMPMTMARLPIAFSWDSRNSLPMVKAMKPRAVWVTIRRLSTCSRELKPMPLTPNAPMKKGPSSNPATRYPVTTGRCTSLVSLDIIRPPTRATARVIRYISTFKRLLYIHFLAYHTIVPAGIQGGNLHKHFGVFWHFFSESFSSAGYPEPPAPRRTAASPTSPAQGFRGPRSGG